MVYEDDNVFVYEKPAGWVCASPNPKVKTTYSAVKAYLESKAEERIDVHFVNKLPREASGLCGDQIHGVAPALANALEFVCQGHVRHGARTPSGRRRVVLASGEADPYALPYRTMRATNMHTLLKFKAGYDCIKDMLPALRREDCLLIGVGKAAPDPIKRGGIHLLPWPSKDLKGRPSTSRRGFPMNF